MCRGLVILTSLPYDLQERVLEFYERKYRVWRIVKWFLIKLYASRYHVRLRDKSYCPQLPRHPTRVMMTCFPNMVLNDSLMKFIHSGYRDREAWKRLDKDSLERSYLKISVKSQILTRQYVQSGFSPDDWLFMMEVNGLKENLGLMCYFRYPSLRMGESHCLHCELMSLRLRRSRLH